MLTDVQTEQGEAGNERSSDYRKGELLGENENGNVNACRCVEE